MVTIGPCGFIPVRLSISCPDLGTPIPLFKIPMGLWIQSLCPGPVACLSLTMVGWLVISIQFAVLVLRIFPKCSGHSSWFWWYIVDTSEEIFFCSRFNLFARVLFNFFIASTILLVIYSILFLAICPILLLAICSIVSLAFGTIVLPEILLLFISFLLKRISWSFWLFSSLLFYLLCGVILSLLTVMFTMLLKCAVLCYGYAAQL